MKNSHNDFRVTLHGQNISIYMIHVWVLLNSCHFMPLPMNTSHSSTVELGVTWSKVAKLSETSQPMSWLVTSPRYHSVSQNQKKQHKKLSKFLNKGGWGFKTIKHHQPFTLSRSHLYLGHICCRALQQPLWKSQLPSCPIRTSFHFNFTWCEKINEEKDIMN